MLLVYYYAFGSHHPVWNFSLYNDDKNIWNNVPWERGNIKSLGLVGTMGKRGRFSTFIAHLSIVSMRIVTTFYCDPCGWLFVLYLLLRHNVLLLLQLDINSLSRWIPTKKVSVHLWICFKCIYPYLFYFLNTSFHMVHSINNIFTIQIFW